MNASSLSAFRVLRDKWEYECNVLFFCPCILRSMGPAVLVTYKSVAAATVSNAECVYFLKMSTIYRPPQHETVMRSQPGIFTWEIDSTLLITSV